MDGRKSQDKTSVRMDLREKNLNIDTKVRVGRKGRHLKGQMALEIIRTRAVTNDFGNAV